MPPRRLPWRMAADEGPTTKEMAGRCFKRLRLVGNDFHLGWFMILEENKELGQWKGKKGNDLVEVLGGMLYTNNMISIYH